MVKKYWVYFLLAFSLSFFIYKKFIYKPKSLSFNLIELKNGWGYEILEHNKVLITQTTIPAVSGYQVFKTKEEATAIANVVINKMEVNKKGMPDISLRELDSCKITYIK
ncbi:MAG: DUF4907 domain-containing protein [Chitinophagaceae bacterium]